MIHTVLVILVCWLGFNVAVLVAAVIYTVAEEHLERDPLERLFGDEQATVIELYPTRDRQVTGVTKTPPATLATPGRLTRGDVSDARRS